MRHGAGLFTRILGMGETARLRQNAEVGAIRCDPPRLVARKQLGRWAAATL